MKIFVQNNSVVFATNAGQVLNVEPLNTIRATAGDGDNINFYYQNQPTTANSSSLFRVDPFQEILDASGTPIGATKNDTLLALCSILNYLPTSPTAPAAPPETYSVTVTGLNAAANATDIFELKGIAGKTVRIVLASLSSTKTGSTQVIDASFLIRDANNTGGTPINITPVPFDGGNTNLPAGQAKAYTANPTLGAIRGAIYVQKMAIDSTNGTPQAIIQAAGPLGRAQVPTLSKATHSFCINLNNYTVNSETFDITVIFTVE